MSRAGRGYMPTRRLLFRNAKLTKMNREGVFGVETRVVEFEAGGSLQRANEGGRVCVRSGRVKQGGGGG